MKIPAAILALLLLIAPALAGQPAGGPPSRSVTLSFSYRSGDKFRVLSEVREDVYVNRVLQYRAEILNRIAFEVADASPDGSTGTLSGSFVTSERPTGGSSYSVTESYDSVFTRDARGRMEIDPRYYMPVVRNVPIFPDKPLSPGDSWTAPGEERHDFRPIGIPDPYAFPFEARYRYIGPAEEEGKKLERLTCSYTVFATPGPPRAWRSRYPVQIAGYTDQEILWDQAMGQPSSYSERFRFVFDWSDGTVTEFRGTAGSRIVEAELMDRSAVAEEIVEAVRGLEGVSVAPVEEGVAIRLEDLRFKPDSPELLPGEEAKLESIAEVLRRYPDRDILVGGHTALAGTAEGRAKLSLERARAVADRLIGLGVRAADRVQVRGYGAERPIADNATEAGKARNRRVEIVLLEN